MREEPAEFLLYEILQRLVTLSGLRKYTGEGLVLVESTWSSRGCKVEHYCGTAAAGQAGLASLAGLAGHDSVRLHARSNSIASIGTPHQQRDQPYLSILS